MSTWTDSDESDLLSKIRAANIQKEPESKDFWGLPDANYWRTLGVMQQQVPFSQIGDKWTKEGKDRQKIEDERILSREKEKREQDFEKGWLGSLFRYFPTPSQTAALVSYQQGNIPQMVMHMERAAREASRTASKQEADEIRRLKANIEEMAKQLQEAQKNREKLHPGPGEHKKGKETKKKARKGKGGPCTNKKWVEHYKGVKAGNPGMCYKDLLEKAKSSYKRN